jgi:F-type H+-transporting ATPase subunit epsilon
MPLPENIKLDVVTPEGLLLRDEVDEVVAPGADGYFGVRPGHTPMLTSLGAGGITFRKGTETGHLTCFWGFCEVLPDRVSILADVGERAEDIDVVRAERAKSQAEARLEVIRDEPGYEEAHKAYIRAVTRLSVAARLRQP